MRKRLCFGAVVLLGVGCAHAPESAPTPSGTTYSARANRPPLLSLPEIMKRMDASPVHYDLSTSATFTTADREAAASRFWGDSSAALPEVEKDSSGRLTVGHVAPPAGAAEASYLAAEKAFAAHDFATAERDYAAALAITPNNYVTVLAWGETALYQREFQVAIDRFTRAIQVNPWAHPAYAYRGEALLALGRREEAVRDYARALARRPRWPVLLKEIEVRADALGVLLAADRLLPAVRVTQTDGGVKIEVDAHHPGWLGFGACKAYWLAEESHRVEMTGSARHVGTSTEEDECLAALLDGYLALRTKDASPPEPALDEAVEIVKHGFANELILYEILSRMDGNVVASLPSDEVSRLEQYVRTYVLIDVGSAPPSTPKRPPAGPPPNPKDGSMEARR